MLSEKSKHLLNSGDGCNDVSRKQYDAECKKCICKIQKIGLNKFVFPCENGEYQKGDFKDCTQCNGNFGIQYFFKPVSVSGRNTKGHNKEISGDIVLHGKHERNQKGCREKRVACFFAKTCKKRYQKYKGIGDGHIPPCHIEGRCSEKVGKRKRIRNECQNSLFAGSV